MMNDWLAQVRVRFVKDFQIKPPVLISGYINNEVKCFKMLLKVKILSVFLIYEIQISEAMDHSECYRGHRDDGWCLFPDLDFLVSDDIGDLTSDYENWFLYDTLQPVTVQHVTVQPVRVYLGLANVTVWHLIQVNQHKGVTVTLCHVHSLVCEPL